MEEIIKNLLGIGILVLGGIVTKVLLPRLVVWLQTKTENELLHAVIDELSKTAETAVGQVQQTFTNQLKSTGVWTEETARQARLLAVGKVKSNLTSTAVDFLVENTEDIEETITRYVESSLYNLKNRK